jgi:hypothetical protein
MENILGSSLGITVISGDFRGVQEFGPASQAHKARRCLDLAACRLVLIGSVGYVPILGLGSEQALLRADASDDSFM